MDASRLYDHLDEVREALSREFGSPIAVHEAAPDLLVLMDDLSTAVYDAPAIPLTSTVRFQREDVKRILDAMRTAIPQQI